MLKKTCILVLLVTLLCASTAVAEVTNRDMQMLGGVLVSNATDSFFFCPMEPGVTRHWGLYALSSAANGPIKEISDGYPARLIHADAENVYFLGYTDAERTLHTLYSVNIASGTTAELLPNIAAAYVESEDTFLYVDKADPYMLCRYEITSQKSTKIKSMEKSEKTIYDAIVHQGTLYFTTHDKNGGEDGYRFNDSTNLANNLDAPSPKLYKGLLYEGYRIYATDQIESQVYSLKIGNKNATQIGSKYNVSLSSFRFGEAVYVYDGEANALVRLPLDGSSEQRIGLDGNAINRLIMGGSKDELFLYSDGAIYSITPDLSSKSRLFDFDVNTGGVMWTHIVPARNNTVVAMGYNVETASNVANMLPTGVYVYDRSNGQMLFGYPEYNPEVPVEVTRPETFGDVPEEEREDETYFVF